MTGERQSRRPDAFVAHPDFLLHELDELHEFRNGIESKERQEPAIDVRVVEERHRFLRQRVDESRDPSDCACCDSFDDQVVDADQDFEPSAVRADRRDAADVGRRFLHRVQILMLVCELGNLLGRKSVPYATGLL